MKRNFKKVFLLFSQIYKDVPLEVFKSDPYKVLVSTLISSRTKDEVTLKASKRLFEKAPNLEKLSKLDVKDIEKLIYPVGFYKVKAKRLITLARILIRNYKSEVPEKRVELMKLPGVGRKTANLVLNRAFGVPAIAVDTHVHNISNLLKWVDTKRPEDTEKELVKILPRKYWKDINRLFVSVGRQFRSKKKLLDFLQSNNLIK